MLQDKIFYTPDITPDDKTHTLPQEESQHAVKVLRMTSGDRISLVDGQGNAYDATITNPHQKRCEVEILSVESNVGAHPYRLHIAIAPTKLNERMEWFLEKCTEIGIDEITPILTAHSERKERKNERMEKIIVAAMKQSQKAFKPVLNEMTPVKKLIEQATEQQKFICHCHPGDKTPLKDCTKGGSVLVLIGPEGDFSEDEVALAEGNGFKPCSLGASRLRTETAGIAACHTVELINE